MSDTDTVLYEVVDDSIAVISLNRPDKANAQTPDMLDLLDQQFTRAADDPAVRVIVLRANGKHFSAGHDIRVASDRNHGDWDPKRDGLARIYEYEAKRYLGYSRKWRDIRKPTLAAVQGQCIAGALLLVWPMDIILAADNAKFSDPVVHMGIGGVEYHGHTWELGPRKAKEWLYTGDAITAGDAYEHGLVNRVVPDHELFDTAFAWARKLAAQAPVAVEQIKAVSAAGDLDEGIEAEKQGFAAAFNSEDAKEGISAFLGKRTPKWSGK